MSKFKYLLEGSKITPYRVDVQREGERGVDMVRVEIPINVRVRHGYKFEYLYDDADIDDLVLALPFQQSLRDESGNELDVSYK